MNLFRQHRKTLSERLAKDASRKGICQEWHDKLLTLDDKHDMVEMYLRGIDFCLSNDFPTNDFIREHFAGVMERHGVFLDDTIDAVNCRKVVALGTTSGNAKFYGYAVGEVFAKHNAVIWVYACENAFVMVDVFDNATVHICASGNARVRVNRYGGWVRQYASDNNADVKIREKNKPTY